jgi:hypothetical protein
MKRIIIIESNEEEYVNRFVDDFVLFLDTLNYKDEIELTHFKED